MPKEFPPNPKEAANYQLDDETITKQFQEIVDNFYTTEGQEPSYEKSSAPQEVKNLGKQAVESTVTIQEQPHSKNLGLKDDFEATSPDELDAMTDDEILERFYRPSEVAGEQNFTEAKIPETSQEELSPTTKMLTLKPVTTPPQSSYSVQPEKQENSNEQIPEIENELIESFVTSINALPERPEEEYRTKELDQDQRSLLAVAEDLLHATIRTRLKEGQEVHVYDPNMPIVTPNTLSEEEMNVLVDSLTKDRAIILPIYKIYHRLHSRMDTMPAGPEKQETADQAAFFYSVASRLMVMQAPGWNEMYVDYLREMLAIEHENLKV